ncbi:MAG: polyprenyl synthetase family protein [Thermodesulfobacteriota bacterium]|nr:polyprenyl synthetase family protein [Thermodesulfobacteriota bacterium]
MTGKRDELKNKILSDVAGDLAEIEKALADNLAPRLPLVSDIAGHLLFSGGKRLRPLILVLSARLCGYKKGYEIVFSTIFEYLHAATLLHDDVVDQADMRRGNTAAHRIWKAPEVILTGDFLFARSLSIASRTKSAEIIEIVAEITEEMSQGEIDQLDKKGRLNLSEQEYMEIIRAKTAVLIKGACHSGAVLAGIDEKRKSALSEYGFHLGMAFQMADDLLDYTADVQTLGKTPGADIREGKLTLPLIFSLSKANERDRKKIEALIQNSCISFEEFNHLIDLLHKYKGISYTESKAEFHVKKAKEKLEVFELSRERDILMMLADYAIARNY